MKKTKKRYVVLTDCHRDIRAGVLESFDKKTKTAVLRECRVCYSYICHEKGEGIGGLAVYGPNKGSRICPVVTIATCCDVNTILDCSEIAESAWRAATWE